MRIVFVDLLFCLFLVLSVICYICFLLVEDAPLWIGIIGVLGILVSLYLNIRSLIRIYKKKRRNTN